MLINIFEGFFVDLFIDLSLVLVFEMFPLSFERTDVVFVVFEEEDESLWKEGDLEEFVELKGSEE
jgi:hypothetical protein